PVGRSVRHDLESGRGRRPGRRPVAAGAGRSDFHRHAGRSRAPPPRRPGRGALRRPGPAAFRDGLMILHGYWRSGTSYRTRIALTLKGLAYDQVGIDLRTGAHKSEAFLRLNPQGLVPALEADGTVLTQSPAILEWLEERHPEPPLL